MLILGGICFLFFSFLSENLKDKSLFKKALIGSGFITFGEFIFGLIFNIILKKDVWNYSDIPFNFCGQICAFYSFLWFLLSLVFIPFSAKLSRLLKEGND